MASSTPHRSTRLSSRKEKATPKMSDKVIEHDEQFDDEALDDEDRTLATTEDDEDVQDVVPVGERGIAGTPTVTGAPHRSPVEYVPSWLPGYLRNSIAELLKVTWPSQREAINLTIVVVSMVAIFVVVFGLLDVAFSSGLQFIIAHIH